MEAYVLPFLFYYAIIIIKDMKKEIKNLALYVLRNHKIDKVEVLSTLKDFFDYAVEFDNSLHNDEEAIDYITEDLARIAMFIPTVGSAKAICESLFQNTMSNSDENWRKFETTDYKLSIKSGTNHQSNLRGSDGNRAFTQIYYLINNFYYDMKAKADILGQVSSNLKKGFELGIWEPVVKKPHMKYD